LRHSVVWMKDTRQNSTSLSDCTQVCLLIAAIIDRSAARNRRKSTNILTGGRTSNEETEKQTENLLCKPANNLRLAAMSLGSEREPRCTKGELGAQVWSCWRWRPCARARSAECELVRLHHGSSDSDYKSRCPYRRSCRCGV